MWGTGRAPDFIFSDIRASGGAAVAGAEVVLSPSPRKGGPNVVFRNKFVAGGRNNELDPMIAGFWAVAVEGYVVVADSCAGGASGADDTFGTGDTGSGDDIL